MSVKSGVHLGVVHSWIQWKCKNGEHVTWGSETDVLHATLTPARLERLAQDIADSVFREIKQLVKVCDNFEIDYGKSFDVCKHCGHRKFMHQEQFGL